MSKITVYHDFWPKWYGEEFSDIFERLLDELELTKPVEMFSVFGNTPPSKDAINITFSGECCDHVSVGVAGGFHAHLIHRASDLERGIVCFPYFTFYPTKHNLWPVLQQERPYPYKKDRFCLFVVSNPHSMEHVRNQVMFEIHRTYKKVDSCGAFFNNTGFRAPGHSGEHNSEYLKLISRYKFMICFENQSSDYYCTEKLYNAYLGGAVPIYWGASKVLEWFNPKCMLILEEATPEGVKKLIDRIRELDEDDEKYDAVYREPLLRDGRVPRDMDPDRIRAELREVLTRQGFVAPARRRILVTGGTGLVGRAIASVAGEGGHENDEFVFLGSKDGDLRDALAVRDMLAKHAPVHGIIHLAANVGGLFKNMEKPVEMLEDNLLMNTHILREAHLAGIDNVLCVLSTCVFPDKPPSYPIEPWMLHQGPPHPSNEGYAYAKRIMEVQCRTYQRQYKRRYFTVTPTNVYGPNDNFSLTDGHVIPSLIHKCHLAICNKTDFVVGGDGTPVRQFIYSEDLARVILWAYDHYENIEESLVACPPEEYSIGQVASAIAASFDEPIAIVYDTTKANGQMKKTALGSPVPFPFKPLEDGIRTTVTWFLEQKEGLRK